VNHPPLPVAPAASRADARCVPGSSPAPPPEPADPLDAWLRRGLSRRFGAAAGEPVPEDPPRPVGEDRDRAGTDESMQNRGGGYAAAGSAAPPLATRKPG
jgi:hypothetical protein